MKTSHFEERIALSAMQTAQRRDESTQRELATFDNDIGGAWLVPPRIARELDIHHDKNLEKGRSCRSSCRAYRLNVL